MTFGEPVDPRYLLFKDGWDKYVVGKINQFTIRWSPWERGGAWLYYERDKFLHVDTGIPDGPATPLKWAWDKRDDRMEYTLQVFYGELPKLFATIDSTYNKYKVRSPRIVWSPYNGSWREMRSISTKPPGPGKGPGDTGNGPVADLQVRLDALSELYRAGTITDDQYKHQVKALLDEYL